MPIRITDLRSDKEITDLTDARYLKLDQSTQQSIILNPPVFEKGLIIKAGQKLVLNG